MIISPEDDDVGMTKKVEETLLDNIWQNKVDYILSFTTPIYDFFENKY